MLQQRVKVMSGQDAYIVWLVEYNMLCYSISKFVVCS